MSLGQFPNEAQVLPVDTGETCPLGRYRLSEALQLLYIPLRILKVGTPGGSESMTLKVWGSDQYNGTPIATSTAVPLAGIAGLTTNWIGDVRFDFARQNLGAGVWYYVTLSIASYTRTGSFYISAVREWPFSFNTVIGEPAGQLVFIGYKENT
jgi:hypothetical protein